MNDTQPGHTASPAKELFPWWLGFLFDNVFRKVLQDPARILLPYIKEGWTALDLGPGPGFFTIPLARMVGDSGKVIAADIQPKMLESIRRKALKAGLLHRISLHLNTPDKIGLNEPIDFCLAFWMLHEVPDRPGFIREIAAALKPDGLFLLVEPKVHVPDKEFDESLTYANNAGLALASRPAVFFSNSALLKK